MGQAAYNTSVKIGGTPTEFTGAATTDLGGNVFKIAEATKSVWSRGTTPTVYVDGAEVADTTYTVDYLFGEISFENPPAGAVTVDGQYMPTLDVGGANTYSVEISGDILTDTDFKNANSNSGHQTKCYGLLDVAASVGRFDDSSKTLRDKLKNREDVLLEISISKNAETIRGWFVVESAGSSGDLGALEAESLSFQLSGNDVSNFSWRKN